MQKSEFTLDFLVLTPTSSTDHSLIVFWSIAPLIIAVWLETDLLFILEA